MEKKSWIIATLGVTLVGVIVGALLFCNLVLKRMDTIIEASKETQKNSEEMALQVEITNSLISSDTIRLKVIEYLKHRSRGLTPVQCVSIGGVIMEGVKLYQIPASLTLAIIEKESVFDPKIVSPKGAIGLMQILPATALPYLRAGTSRFPSIKEALLDPETNVRVGVAYLNDLHIGMGSEPDFLYSLTAYNFGEAGARALRANTPMAPATLAYASSVIALQRQIRPGGSVP